ncbi:hypothetical protein F53441_4142 [Fusarium austroafricanum]|uniref:Clr5 domain-containing protein n=1 Tax=Fusarium austroafricanum TaxID=2364996 RepID=A0A8H4KKV8_9HYPO|nr:hypothetical protein F53441_4142 [Fusarium austroafricanum]
MPETEKIPAWRWEENKEHIRALYIDKNTKLDELIHLMERDHAFVATKAQYIRKLGNWKMKKNATQGEWKHAERLIGKRKLEGKDTDIVIKGKVVSANKLRKELGRYGWVQSYGPAASSPQHSPSAIAAITPPDSNSRIVLVDTIPWFQFQNSARLLIKPTDTPNSDNSLANILFSQGDLSLLTDIVLKQSVSIDDATTIEQLRSVIQSQVPQKSDFSMDLQSTALAHDPWLPLIEWVIYRSTNNLLNNLEAYDLLSFISSRTLACTNVGNLVQEICHINGPTTKIILSNLLVAATIRGHSSQARLFLELGADPESKDRTFSSAMSVIQLAAQRHDKHLLAMLLQKGADPNRSDCTIYEVKSPLMLALETPGGFDVLELLVNSGADVNRGYFTHLSIWHGTCPLEQAVWNGEFDCAKLLIDAEASIDNPWILRSAVELKDQKMISLLLGAGMAPNPSLETRISKETQTNLDLAVEIGAVDCVETLIAAGIKSDDQALLRTLDYDDTKMFNLLVAAGLDVNVPQLGIGHELMQSTYPLRVRDINRNSFLSIVAPTRVTSEVAIIQHLLDAGADIDRLSPVPFEYQTPQTALQTAVEWSHHSVSKFLLDKGASPNKRSPASPTPLQQACEDLVNRVRDSSTQREIINALLESGADVNAAPATVVGAQTAL